MLKMVGTGVTVLLMTASSLGYAQSAREREFERLNAADVAALTDSRVNIVKSTLQLTPDQEKRSAVSNAGRRAWACAPERSTPQEHVRTRAQRRPLLCRW